MATLSSGTSLLAPEMIPNPEMIAISLHVDPEMIPNQF